MCIRPLGITKKKTFYYEELRGINFEDVIEAIVNGDLIDDIDHPNKEYKSQRIMVLRINNYIHLAPYIKDSKGIFLKTVFASRKFNKLYEN